MRRTIPVLFCALLATAGCGSSATKPASKADIAAVEVSLTSAIRLANTCLAQTVGPCRVTATRAKLIADIHTAHDAFKQVQAMNAAGTPVTLSLVTTAMSQLVADTPK